MLSPSKIKSIFSSIISQMSENVQHYVLSPGKDFTRNRKCSFSDLILAILSFENHSLPKEIADYFASVKRPAPSPSAFVQQRAKLNDEAFPALFHAFNSSIPFTKTLKGIHLIACDGTDINLPTDHSDSLYRVRYKKDARIQGYWQMHVTACYDLLENRYLDLIIQPRPFSNETAALCTMVQRCPLDGKLLYIADRGFPSLNVMAHIFDVGQFFLFRVTSPESCSSFLKHADLPRSGEFDRKLTLRITRSYRKKYRKHPERYHFLHRKRTFDFIDPGDRDTVFALDLRVICVTLGNGTKEYLVTNLPADSFSLEDLKELYRLRWGIETSFRSLKYALSLSCLHSIKRSFIIQEIYAKMIMYNWASLLAAFAEKGLPSKRNGSSKDYHIPFCDAVRITRRLISERITNSSIRILLQSRKIPIRTGRVYPRNVRSQSAVPLNYRG